MKRGPLMRRVTAAVLISTVTLMIAAFVPLIYGLRIEDAARLGSGVFASQADTILISRPIRISSAPDIVLTSATLIAAPALPGQRRAIKLIAPVFAVTIGAGAPVPALVDVMATLDPLAGQFALTNVDAILMQGGTIDFSWGAGHAVTLTAFDAKMQIRGATTLSAKGKFDYRGQAMSFEAATAPVAQPLAISPDLAALARPITSQKQATVWPLRLHVTSPLLDMNLEGALDAGRTLNLDGNALVSTPDATKFARWLGNGWRGHGAGTAVRINGPLHWSDGTLTFGKSVVSLNDQTGTGALSLRFRETRPLIEASLAFPALDVSPFLTAEAATIVPKALLKIAGQTARPSTMAWRSLSMSFPATTSIDVDWRLSAQHLQWQGEPIGSAAVSITANDGKLSADFAELDVGPHKGTLQVTSDNRAASAGTGAYAAPSVTIRGQFRSADGDGLCADLLGASVVSGVVASQFEVAGTGQTLREVLQTANGSGIWESSGGTLSVDLAAVQSMARSAAIETPGAGWSAIAGKAAYENLAAKWKLRDGLFVVDQFQVQSNGLLAKMRGQIGAAPNELDLVVQVTPIAAGGNPRGPLSRSSAGLTRSKSALRDTIAIQGTTDRPIFSPLDMDRLP